MKAFRLFQILIIILLSAHSFSSDAQTTVELNSTGGTNNTNGLHFYISNNAQIQVRRLNNTGQVYSPSATPPSTSLDNGIFLRANGLVYGPSHTVTTFNPSGGMYNTATISAVSPANPATSGTQQTAMQNLGITGGPQIAVNWKYTTPLDFITAEVTVTIPAAYPISASNPVRYYHVFDTYLGGSDSGCGFTMSASGKRIVGTYSAVSGACPTSTGLPSGVDVVESFRERTGTFSNWCANYWSDFFTGGTSNCGVLQSTNMSNAISSTLMDTGIGIQYNFTSAGTYTFSYDFVIGSTQVPNYDHIEIRHDGSATNCPENVIVVACMNAGPNCTPVSTGNITGSLTWSPNTNLTATPSSFTVGSSGLTANISLQSTGFSGARTLSATGLSSIPLNGVQCANLSGTAMQSCNLNFTNTACVSNFECLAANATYVNRTTPGNRNPLYTKMSATPFQFDVVAVDSTGAQQTTFAGDVTVELVDDTGAPSCSAAPNIASTLQTLTFNAAQSGRRSTNAITLNTAHKRLRCRVKTTSAPNITACSSDTFTVRPPSFTSITSSNANGDANGLNPSANNPIKAGTYFNLTAATARVGYDGLPKVAATMIEWLNAPANGRPAPGVGTLAGAFTVNANSSTGDGALGNAFTYDEVGYFRFKPNAIYDDSFVDASGDRVNGDCTNDFSNSLVNEKLGCKFGNATDTQHFGRFIPNHFAVTTTTLNQGCNANNANAFTYMDQPFALASTIAAQNKNNATTMNYANNFAKSTIDYEMENANNGTALDKTRLNIVSGVWNAGQYIFSANRFSRLPATPVSPSTTLPPDGPFDNLAVGIKVLDAVDGGLLMNRDMQADNTACTASTVGTTDGNCAAKQIASMKMRHGRINLQNAYGSEKLALPLPLRVEYWAGSASGVYQGWVKNTLDTSCTVPNANQFALNFPVSTPANNLSACETALSTSLSATKLSAPGVGNNGFVDVTLNLGATANGNQCVVVGGLGGTALTMNAPWLQWKWKGSTTYTNPSARAQFGTYKKSSFNIYTRENY